MHDSPGEHEPTLADILPWMTMETQIRRALEDNAPFEWLSLKDQRKVRVIITAWGLRNADPADLVAAGIAQSRGHAEAVLLDFLRSHAPETFLRFGACEDEGPLENVALAGK